MNRTLSESEVIKTGVQQDYASSPVLFAFYTNNCKNSYPSTFIIKFFDDTAILGLMGTGTDVSVYSSEVGMFVQWCDDHHLIVSIKKTEGNIFALYPNSLRLITKKLNFHTCHTQYFNNG